nr:hypothetical protein [Ruminococcus bromii]
MLDCMKTENYFAEKKRMIKRAGIGVCRIKCEDCPLGITNNGMDVLCSELETLYPEKAIAIVQKWSNAHPQRTYLSELLKIFPNTPLEDDGTPNFCPYRLGLISIDDCRKDRNCVKCWNRIIEDGKE